MNMPDEEAAPAINMMPARVEHSCAREIIRQIYVAAVERGFSGPICPAELIEILTRDDSARTYARLPPIKGDIVFYYDGSDEQPRAAIVADVLANGTENPPLTLQVIYANGIRIVPTAPHVRAGTRRGRWSRRSESISEPKASHDSPHGERNEQRNAEHPRPTTERAIQLDPDL